MFDGGANLYSANTGTRPENVEIPHLDVRPPSTSSVQFPLGKRWIDTVAQAEYTLVGFSSIGGTLTANWESGGNAAATTTTAGIVTLSTLAQLETGTAPAGAVVPKANDVFTFVNSVVIAGGTLSTEAAPGLIQEATDAQAVAGTNLNPGTPLAVQPKSLAAVFASNPAIGGTAPNSAAFTTVNASGLITGSGSATITTGATTLNLASDAGTGAVNIGTGAAARTITVGNSTGATAISLNVGTGALNLGTNAVAHTVTIGNVTGATAVNINTGSGGSTITTTNATFAVVTGTGAINIGADAAAKTVTIGNQTGASAVTIDSGTGAINIGTAVAKIITIGNVTGATQVVVNTGTAGMAVTTTNGAFALATGTGAISISADAAATTINIGTGAAVVKTIAIGGTGANVITIGDTQTGGSISIGSAMTTGTLVVGGTGAQTGAARFVDGSGAQTISFATGAGVKTLNIATGAAANVVTIGTTNGAASLTLQAGTGGIKFTSGQTVSVTPVATAASPYAVLGGDYFIGTDSTAGIMTITLPAAPATGRHLVVYDATGQAAVNNVTINGNGKNISAAGTSAATKVLTTAFQSIDLVYNGTIWNGRISA